MTYEFESKHSLDVLVRTPNICKLLSEDDCKYIGQRALDGYNEDKNSRLQWEQRNAMGMELALQVMRGKTDPWPGCSNVKFPLITVAALQYHARAYPALIDTTDLVKARVYGADPNGDKTARAERISTHMSWQNIEQDTGWEESHDKGLLAQSIMGDVFIKQVFDPGCGYRVTQLVLPKDFYIDYYTRDLESSPRYTHVFQLSRNVIRQRELLGIYHNPYDESYEGDQDLPKAPLPTGPLKQAQDQRQGMSEPAVSRATPYDTGEQYCWWDLDGDGFDEPYIVTFDIGTGLTRRIVARYNSSGIKKLNGKVYEIKPIRVFTKIPFIPSPDGGFYDIGLGTLLGPLNESVNTALNQIFDAGTMATLGGGFLGRGFKARGGPFNMRPHQWYPIDAPGDDLRKNILPLPVREPSNVLFQVLGLLIQYAERVVGATDIQLGENPGQNTPAETTRTLNENGSRVYNAIYKRTWRALRDEYDIQFDINQMSLGDSEDYYDLTNGKGAIILKDDYLQGRMLVCPAADPHVVSDTARVQQAAATLQMPHTNKYESEKRLLKAMKVPDIDRMLPPPMGPDGKPLPDYPPPQDPKMLDIQIKQQKLQLEAQKFQSDSMQARIELQLQVQHESAEIVKLYAEADKALAEAGASRADPAIKMIYAKIEAAGMRQDAFLRALEIVAKNAQSGEGEGKSKGNGQVMEGFSAPPAVTNADLLSTLQ